MQQAASRRDKQKRKRRMKDRRRDRRKEGILASKIYPDEKE